MAGYHGYSMSNNAVEAYDRGLMPRSKWTKSDILDELTDLLKGEEAKAKIEVLAKMPTEKVRSYCLNYKERHHTGKYYNYTDFYEVDIDAVNELTLTELQERLSSIERQKAERREAKKGQQRHRHCERLREIVYYRAPDKMIKTSVGNKRLTSLYVVFQVEQKTKYASAERLKKMKERGQRNA